MESATDTGQRTEGDRELRERYGLGAGGDVSTRVQQEVLERYDRDRRRGLQVVERSPYEPMLDAIRELHALGATRVKVGTIEAEFPVRLLPADDDGPSVRPPEDAAKEYSRIARASGAGSDDE